MHHTKFSLIASRMSVVILRIICFLCFVFCFIGCGEAKKDNGPAVYIINSGTVTGPSGKSMPLDDAVEEAKKVRKGGGTISLEPGPDARVSDYRSAKDKFKTVIEGK